jgi:hypothetical protein
MLRDPARFRCWNLSRERRGRGEEDLWVDGAGKEGEHEVGEV